MALKTSLKVTPKDDKKVAKKDGKLLPCLIVYSLIQKEKEWLIDYLYFILRYLILINFDMIL